MHLLQLLVVQRLQSITVLLVLLQILLLVLLHLPEILIKRVFLAGYFLQVEIHAEHLFLKVLAMGYLLI